MQDGINLSNHVASLIYCTFISHILCPPVLPILNLLELFLSSFKQKSSGFFFNALVIGMI